MATGPLERQRCQVVGLNQNYVSPAGTVYHIQIEDRGPVFDALSEADVRRVNLIVYANYGEPNARIILGRDYDFPDLRTQEQNRFIEERIKQLSQDARELIQAKETRNVARIKGLIREYYHTKDEATKRELEKANAGYPFLFSRAWRELKEERKTGPAATPEAATAIADGTTAAIDVHYPMDAELREQVIEIERMIAEIGQDLEQLKARGRADDILLQTCRKLEARAKESLSGRDPAAFTSRRLDMTRNSLMTTWRQIKSRLRAS